MLEPIAVIVAVIVYSIFRTWQSMVAFVCAYVSIFALARAAWRGESIISDALLILPVLGTITAVIAVGLVWLKDRYGGMFRRDRE